VRTLNCRILRKKVEPVQYAARGLKVWAKHTTMPRKLPGYLIENMALQIREAYPRESSGRASSSGGGLELFISVLQNIVDGELLWEEQ
jgi:hypothetical protein